MSEHELYHFGVKGMKWGVRKKNPQMTGDARRAARAERKQFKRDVKDYKKGRYQDRHDLSFTAKTTKNRDGSVSIDSNSARYYSGKKRISAEKYKELSDYTNKVAMRATMDMRKQEIGRTVVASVLGLGLAAGSIVARRNM